MWVQKIKTLRETGAIVREIVQAFELRLPVDGNGGESFGWVSFGHVDFKDSASGEIHRLQLRLRIFVPEQETGADIWRVIVEMGFIYAEGSMSTASVQYRNNGWYFFHEGSSSDSRQHDLLGLLHLQPCTEREVTREQAFEAIRTMGDFFRKMKGEAEAVKLPS